MNTPSPCLFATVHVPWPWFRQTEDGAGRIGTQQFYLNEVPEQAEEPQWLAVLDEPQDNFCTRVPKERRILFITEPPAVKVYPPRYLNQFGIVVSAFPPAGFKGTCLITNPCLNWHYGLQAQAPVASNRFRTLHDFAHMPPPAKTKLLSVICSTKTFTPEQIQRQALVKALKHHFGDKLDVFGRGVRDIQDKAEAIDDYQYHIVLENNVISHFWTEKLSDSLLGWSFPLYCGAHNITQHIPRQAICVLDYNDVPGTIAAIEHVLEEKSYEARLEALTEARNWIIAATNIFQYTSSLIARMAQHSQVPLLAQPQRIKRTSRWEIAVFRRLRKYGFFQAGEKQ
ncbi:glycosyltransferase family 10 domain-containing protein [Desulfovibrio cuneatus]|uniref:glycosyltransferase family 10 domain-containing protein n=1 Tax=Desulfovibrio cuneatus TaxID=159728 RepID=UPI00041434A7|nr:glycosyltransferase family 10 [Desulfovibrio cuneatus]